MNRRNILRGVAQSNLSAPPAALIYRAVLCCIFAVSLSIIHETQIPFTFFRDFLKKVFGGEEEPHRHCFGMPPVRVAAPSVHIVQSTRVLLAAAPTTPPCFRHWRRSSLLPSRGGLGKTIRLHEMPRPPPTSGGCRRKATGGFPHQKAPPSLKGAMGALYHITMGSAYSALGASGAFASSAFAAGSAGAAGAAAGFGACFTTGLGGFGSSFSGKRMMCLGHF